MTSLIPYSDPRIGLSASLARADDGLTRMGIRVLSDHLATAGDRILAAPAFGLPTRVIGMRLGDRLHIILNPRATSVGPFVPSHAEQSPHTGECRRNVLRAVRLTVEGTGIAGQPERLELDKAPAIAMQRALELLDLPLPFGWMTAYHHVWLKQGQNPVGRRCAAINAGLYAATDAQPGDPLHFTDLNQVAVATPDGDGVLCRIDGLNPMRPLDPLDVRLLALMAGMTGLQNTRMDNPALLGAVVAASIVSPVLQVQTGPDPWPDAAIAALGLAGSCHAHGWTIAQMPDAHGLTAPLDSIVIDALRGPDTPLPDQQALGRLSQLMTGSLNAMLIALPSEDEALADRLQGAFPQVSVLLPLSGGAIYAACKTPIDSAQVRARLFGGAMGLGLPDLLEALSDPWFLLRKDGKRMPL